MTVVPDTLKEAGYLKGWSWSGLTLSRQFAIAGGLVMLLGMVVAGGWVSSQIEDGVTRNTGVATALYVDSFISPLTQELATAETLSIGPIRALDEAFRESPLGKRILSVKIWKKGGLIAYSSNYDLIGKKFKPTEELKAAWQGTVAVSYDDLGDDEDEGERAHGIPLLEIYSPIRAPWTGEIIAVAEFYENAEELQESLAMARIKSALVFGGVTLTMALLLMGIVHRGSQTIDKQRKALSDQLQEATRTSEQNKRLKERVQRASERVAELNEKYLNRTGAELHDGPAQLLALASLRIDSLRKEKNANKRDGEIAVIKGALDDAMTDIRNLCRGLTLPDIADLSVQEIIQRVVNNHEERSGTLVIFSISNKSLDIAHSVKICVYRFVQEALNNAWQHAGGIEQRVEFSVDEIGQILTLRVSDGGPGITTENGRNTGLGLVGLRERIESIGGQLEIESSPEKGTTLTMNVKY